MDITNLPVDQLLQKRKRFRRELTAAADAPVRIAVLGGVTTNELVDLLELVLLAQGLRPEFYQSEYNKYYDDAVLEPEKIRAFQPDIVYVCVHWKNIVRFPAVGATESEYRTLLDAEVNRFRAIWASLHDHVGCQIIQNNFELPPLGILGNLDAVDYGGRVRFVQELNLEFAKAAKADRRLLLCDLGSLSARVGHRQWFDLSRWYNYKLMITPEASLELAKSLGAMICALRGKAKKCLVLDLDNTLWGGVIGDDGVERIQIGKETPLGEAYTGFQEYCRELRRRGVLLAISSKNDPDVARAAFSHPDMVLKLHDFAAFRANWEPKHDNIKSIAEELNLGLDSFVNVDDNPAERALVAAQLPAVFVPDVGSDVTRYAEILQATYRFETVSLSGEDLQRAESFAANAARGAMQSKFSDYGAYLDSLEMKAEIGDLAPLHLDRIAQLTNKTNQFNLTTRRYTLAEIQEISTSDRHVAIYGRLEDAFGDNGLVSVIIGRLQGVELHLDLWIMSCRVLKRDMEVAMLDTLVEKARALGAERLIGYYLRTPKNGVVEDHYGKLGFTLMSAEDGGARTVWELDIASYTPANRHIQIRSLVHG